jgi:quercetin dioxygenase-like cupin family protein
VRYYIYVATPINISEAPVMHFMKRRGFMLFALAAVPLASCTSSTSLAQKRRKGMLVRAGRDRANHPKTVFGGLRIDSKVTTDDTAGALYIIEHTDEARGGPGRHVHHTQDEWFYVLEGSYRIEVGEEKFELGPGDSVFAPRQIPHVWAHVSEGIGRLIIAFQPAGQMESFLGALADAGAAPSRDAMAALFESHGMTLLGPPLSVDA